VCALSCSISFVGSLVPLCLSVCFPVVAVAAALREAHGNYVHQLKTQRRATHLPPEKQPSSPATGRLAASTDVVKVRARRRCRCSRPLAPCDPSTSAPSLSHRENPSCSRPEPTLPRPWLQCLRVVAQAVLLLVAVVPPPLPPAAAPAAAAAEAISSREQTMPPRRVSNARLPSSLLTRPKPRRSRMPR